MKQNNNTTVTTFYIGPLNWERVPIEAEKLSQSQAVFTVKEDAIHIKTKTFSLWSIFACGGPRRKRARVFSNRPDPKSDLIYLRFYVYSDNMDSKKVSNQIHDRNEGKSAKVYMKFVVMNPPSRPCIAYRSLRTPTYSPMHKSYKM